MPDSLQHIVSEASQAPVEETQEKSDVEVKDEAQSSGSESNSESGQSEGSTEKSGSEEASQNPHPLKGIILMAHKEPQMPVSPRSTGSTASSWVILALIAVFLLVSMRYARNFKFLSGIGRELLARKQGRRMFDDTVREKSFLVFLNLLCIVSVGALLFGAIEMAYPEVRTCVRWYSALGYVTLAVGLYYIWQWIVYFIIGQTFATTQDAASWMRGFSSGQGFLGIGLFLPALISLFYSGSLTFLVVISAIAYVIMRIVFIVKGIRIFLPRSNSWVPFFYYLCGVEIAPVVLLIHVSTQWCLSVAFS